HGDECDIVYHWGRFSLATQEGFRTINGLGPVSPSVSSKASTGSSSNRIDDGTNS
ncbi:Hypothetical predicted protein, partial [Podarcis lilfordi]